MTEVNTCNNILHLDRGRLGDINSNEGTITFEIANEDEITKSDDGIRVAGFNHGETGSVITGITGPDERAPTPNYENPRAERCLNELQRSGSALEVTITGTNDPVPAGEYLEVTARLENTGSGTINRSARLIVGNDPQRVDSQTVSIEPGGTVQVSMGYETPPVDSTQEFPVRVETDDGSAEQSVRVHGTTRATGAETVRARRRWPCRLPERTHPSTPATG